MRLYTYDELMDDIESVEGVRVELTDLVKRSRFVQLYSECNDFELGVSKTVDDLKKRINKFLRDRDVMLPECDVWPTDEHAFYIYKLDVTNEESLESVDFKAILISTASTKEQAISLMSGDNLKEQAFSICVVSTKTNELMFFNRQQH